MYAATQFAPANRTRGQPTMHVSSAAILTSRFSQNSQHGALWVSAEMSRTQTALKVAELLRETGHVELRASGPAALARVVAAIALAKCMLFAERIAFDVDVKSADMDFEGSMCSGMRFTLAVIRSAAVCLAAG